MNEIRFVPEGVVLSAQYNQQQYDRDFAYDNLLPFQVKRNYKQKKQLTDYNCVQIHSNATAVQLEVRPVVRGFIGAALATINASQTGTFSGNEEDGVQLITKQFDFVLSTQGVTAPGVYCYVLVATFGAETKYYVSEPIYAKDTWPRTVQIEYTHDKNEHGVFFSMNARFRIRAEGYLLPRRVNESNTQFVDQENVNRDLYSETTRIYQLSVTGVPFYVQEKLVEAFKCNYVRINGFRYCRAAGASFEADDNVGASLNDVSVMVNHVKPSDMYTFKTGATLQVMPVPGASAFAVVAAVISDPNVGVVALAPLDRTVIEDATDAASRITALNLFAASQGMQGTFAVSGGYIVYNNAPDESFTNYNVDLRTKILTIDITAPSTNNSFLFRFFATQTNFLDFGDGTTAVVPVLSTPRNYSKTYGNGSATTYTVRLFHEDNISQLDFDSTNGAMTCKLTAISGTAPAQLVYHRIWSTVASSVTSWDFSYLAPCTVLRSLWLMGTSVQTVTDPFALQGGLTPWFYLRDIQFGGNSLTVAAIETLIGNLVNDVYLAYNGIEFGDVEVDGQSPIAAANPTTLGYFSTLAWLGWGTAYD